MNRTAIWWAALGLAVCGFLLWDLGSTLFFALTIAGLAQGGVLALSGIGLVVTYRATGVLNFAHGAIAMFVAFRSGVSAATFCDDEPRSSPPTSGNLR